MGCAASDLSGCVGPTDCHGSGNCCLPNSTDPFWGKRQASPIPAGCGSHEEMVLQWKTLKNKPAALELPGVERVFQLLDDARPGVLQDFQEQVEDLQRRSIIFPDEDEWSVAGCSRWRDLHSLALKERGGGSSPSKAALPKPQLSVEEDPYDPRSPEYIMPATPVEIAEEEARLLHRQATCLRAALEHREEATRQSSPVLQLYRQQAQELQYEALDASIRAKKLALDEASGAAMRAHVEDFDSIKPARSRSSTDTAGSTQAEDAADASVATSITNITEFCSSVDPAEARGNITERAGTEFSSRMGSRQGSLNAVETVGFMETLWNKDTHHRL